MPAMSRGDRFTRARGVRVPDGLWDAYGAVCERRGVTRSEDLLAHVRRMVQRYGTDTERSQAHEADEELTQRRGRAGRPPKTAQST